MIQDVWDICADNICQQQQPIMDFENGVIVKIYMSKVDPISVWGRLCLAGVRAGAELGNKVIGSEEMPILVWGRRKRPPTKMGST